MDFSVIKFDSELRKEESGNWEVVVGNKVIITFPLHVQDRITGTESLAAPKIGAMLIIRSKLEKCS